MKNLISFLIIFSIMILSSTLAYAQDTTPFHDEVKALTEITHNFDKEKEVILFTGSSSIRMWKNLDEYFPDRQILNHGFGGSQMSDLLHFADELILNYHPDKIFIYEGDNDISSGKSTKEIIKDTKTLLEKILSELPDAEIIIISAKPSISRWEMKKKYKSLNKAFQKTCDSDPKYKFANVWDTMLDDTGKPKTDIFLKDNLHMNKAGYDLWAEVIDKFFD